MTVTTLMSWAKLFSHILQRFNQCNVKFIFGIIANTKNHQLRMEDELYSIVISAFVTSNFYIDSKIHRSKELFKNINIITHSKNIQKYYKPLYMRTGNRKTRNMLMNLSSCMNLWRIKGWPVLLTHYRGFDGIFFYGTFAFEHKNYY